TLPFAANIIDGKVKIMATGYDLGPNGYAYYDMDTANYRVSTGRSEAGNRGYAYRNDGVDIERSKDEFVVCHTEKGEWLQYTLQVKSAGSYSIQIQAAAEKEGAKASLLLNGNNVAKAFPISVAGKGKEWAMVDAGNIYLEQGIQQLRLYVEEGGFRLSSIHFTRN
ncbi:MAG: carbohydrate-binding protein, partial [Chitinophagaceae bacterium]|nr:carbohydrate-binding protein [Chitinophagaceae bacterium]